MLVIQSRPMSTSFHIVSYELFLHLFGDTRGYLAPFLLWISKANHLTGQPGRHAVSEVP